MNTGGLVLALAGVWLLAQLFRGQLLQRLGIIPKGN